MNGSSALQGRSYMACGASLWRKFADSLQTLCTLLAARWPYSLSSIWTDTGVACQHEREGDIHRCEIGGD